MADIKVNDVTYNGVESIAMETPDGETVGFYPDAVRYNAQTLTDEQKQQARENIGAAAEGQSGGGVQPDWNQTDETAADFIKNKPFGRTENVLFEEQSVTFEEGYADFNVGARLNVGDTATVKWNGIDYSCVVSVFNDYVAIGNTLWLDDEGDSGEPFVIVWFDDAFVSIMPTTGEVSATVEIKGITEEKIPNHYYDMFIPLYLDATDSKYTYLYNDMELTQKTTADELLALAKKGVIAMIPCIFGVRTNLFLYPQKIHSVDSVFRIESCHGIHYTAEYTPETT